MRRKRKENTEKRLVTIATCLQLYHTVCQRTGLEWTQEKRMARLILYQEMTKIQEKIKMSPFEFNQMSILWAGKFTTVDKVSK